VVKKILSSVSRQSTGLRPGPGHDRSHMCYGAAAYKWGRGLRGFSICVRSSSCYNVVGAVLIPESRVFLRIRYENEFTHIFRLHMERFVSILYLYHLEF
jgi:hypothetical protein